EKTGPKPSRNSRNYAAAPPASLSDLLVPGDHMMQRAGAKNRERREPSVEAQAGVRMLANLEMEVVLDGWLVRRVAALAAEGDQLIHLHRVVRRNQYGMKVSVKGIQDLVPEGEGVAQLTPVSTVVGHEDDLPVADGVDRRADGGVKVPTLMRFG